jgi:hypothetical protein
MKKLEKVLWGLFLVGLIFKLNHWPFAGILTVCSLGLVSSLYFYLGFALFNDVKLRNAFKKSSYASIPKSNLVFGIIFGVSLSIIIIGFLFKFMLWPGASFNLMAGLIILAISLIAYLMISKQKKVSLPKQSFIRILLVGLIGITFYIIKTGTIIDFYYQDNPEYAEALKKVIKHPENVEYRDAINELREQRMQQNIEEHRKRNPQE